MVVHGVQAGEESSPRCVFPRKVPLISPGKPCVPLLQAGPSWLCLEGLERPSSAGGFSPTLLGVYGCQTAWDLVSCAQGSVWGQHRQGLIVPRTPTGWKGPEAPWFSLGLTGQSWDLPSHSPSPAPARAELPSRQGCSHRRSEEGNCKLIFISILEENLNSLHGNNPCHLRESIVGFNCC